MAAAMASANIEPLILPSRATAIGPSGAWEQNAAVKPQATFGVSSAPTMPRRPLMLMIGSDIGKASTLKENGKNRIIGKDRLASISKNHSIT